MTETEVLVVGAGPTGLVLALWLAKSGVNVRIIDKADAPGTTSRAIVMHARNLEYYHQLGIVDAAVAHGFIFRAANFWVRGRRIGRVPFGEIGEGVSPYPYMLIYPQDEHERMLIAQLERSGVRVERETDLLSFEQTTTGVGARLKRNDGSEAFCNARYLAGCDGAHSTVREGLNVGFDGGTYADLFYVADVDASGPVTDGEMHGALGGAEFLVVFPLEGPGHVRLIGALRHGDRSAQTHEWEDVADRVVRDVALTVDNVRWFSTYRVHHRVAGAFRRGRAFILGDAAHVHSPVGGQGMNTGIGDAVNLAWKLAAVVQGRADAALLDTFESERIAFARKLVSTTDRAFAVITARGAVAARIRLALISRILPLAFRFRVVRRLLFRTLSQTALAYRQSSLSVGATGRVRAGDRLPWVRAALTGDQIGDNFASLASRDWQVHVYGDARTAVRALCEARDLRLHVFPWNARIRRTGLRKNATYLIRPDGYIAFAQASGDAAKLQRYIDERQIRAAGRTD